MNWMAGFLGYSAFVLSLLVIAGVGYYYADEVENWATRKLSKGAQPADE